MKLEKYVFIRKSGDTWFFKNITSRWFYPAKLRWRMIFSRWYFTHIFRNLKNMLTSGVVIVGYVFLFFGGRLIFLNDCDNLCETFLLFELIGIVIGGVSLVKIVNFYMYVTTTVLWLVTVVELLDIHSILMVKYSNIHFFPSYSLKVNTSYIQDLQSVPNIGPSS